MRKQEEILKDKRVMAVNARADSGMGFLKLGKRMADAAWVVWSRNGGWDHVSVSYENRCPTWDEMCLAKDIFFEDEERCVEYHPKRSEYVNLHPHCLHIWRPQGWEFPAAGSEPVKTAGEEKKTE